MGAGAQAQNIRADLGFAPPLATTQFQRFVQEATGRNLPLFGDLIHGFPLQKRRLCVWL